MKRNDDAKTVGMHPRAIVVEVLYEDWNHRRILTRRSDSRAVDVSVASRWEPESDAEVIAWLERNELPPEIMTAPLPLCASEKVIEEDPEECGVEQFIADDLAGCSVVWVDELGQVEQAPHAEQGESVQTRDQADQTERSGSRSADKEVGP